MVPSAASNVTSEQGWEHLSLRAELAVPERVHTRALGRGLDVAESHERERRPLSLAGTAPALCCTLGFQLENSHVKFAP